MMNVEEALVIAGKFGRYCRTPACHKTEEDLVREALLVLADEIKAEGDNCPT
jgi:hypothetical protein